jgi:hypothetical protein
MIEHVGVAIRFVIAGYDIQPSPSCRTFSLRFRVVSLSSSRLITLLCPEIRHGDVFPNIISFSDT